MMQAKRKTGRPGAFHRCADGTRIDGLSKLGDGRWRISGPPRFTFRAISEADALRRFAEWQAQQDKETFVVPVATADTPEELAAAINAERTSPYLMEIEIGPNGRPRYVLNRPVDETRFWAELRELILTQKKLVARMTGIEELAWLSELERPVRSPTLKEIGDPVRQTLRVKRQRAEPIQTLLERIHKGC